VTVIVVTVRLVMRFMNDGAVAFARRRTVVRAMISGVILRPRRRPFTRKARACAGQRDNRGQDGAE
jgi:hypothetical protein